MLKRLTLNRYSLLPLTAILLLIGMGSGCGNSNGAQGNQEPNGGSVGSSEPKGGGETPGGEEPPPEPEEKVDLSGGLMPTNGTYGEAAQIEFQFTWQEALLVSGAPRLPLTVGAQTRYAEYVAGSGSATLSFRYTVQAGDHDVDGIEAAAQMELNGGTMTGSVSSNAAALDISGHLGDLSQVQVDTGTQPPAQVTQVVAAPSTDNTLLAVSWSVPADNGTPITHYVVQYREKGASLWSTQSPNPSVNSTSLANLAVNTIYEIRVAASNGVLGPYSSIQEAQIFDIMGFSPIAWLDATDLKGDGSAVSNGVAVNSWVDKTGVASNATEADPAKQPLYHTNVQNGLPAVRFDNLDRGLQGTFTRSNGTSLTILIVGQYDSAYSDRCMFEFLGSGNARAFFIDRRYANNTLYNPALTKGEFKLWRIENSGATASVIENGSTTLINGPMDFNTNFVGTGNYFLGDDSTGGNRMHGYIGEILIFDTALSAQDISRIESYLMTKWGL